MSATPQIIDFTCVLDTNQWGPVERIARAEARAARVAQGLGPKITDARVLARIAGVVVGRQSVTHSLISLSVVIMILAAWGITSALV